MKEFIEKLIGRLEDLRKRNSEIEGQDSQSRSKAYANSIEIVNQLAEEYKLFGNSEQVNNGWIPCSERFPEDWEYVYATCISMIDNREPWVIEGLYYNGCGGFERMSPMLELGDAKVIAWMPKELPAPYQPKDCNNCANNTDFDEVDNGCYMCCKGLEDNYQPNLQ